MILLKHLMETNKCFHLILAFHRIRPLCSEELDGSNSVIVVFPDEVSGKHCSSSAISTSAVDSHSLVTGVRSFAEFEKPSKVLSIGSFKVFHWDKSDPQPIDAFAWWRVFRRKTDEMDNPLLDQSLEVVSRFWNRTTGQPFLLNPGKATW